MQIASFGVTNLDEPIGNFLRIFPEQNLTKQNIRQQIESTGKVITAQPLDYFINVGNGMNVETQKKEIAKIIPDQSVTNIQRAKFALAYLDQGNHIGVSDEQYKADLKFGKDHDATMRFFLQKVLNDETFEPCVVVITKHATTKFGAKVDRVILDGTHRAVTAAIVDTDLEILEFALA